MSCWQGQGQARQGDTLGNWGVAGHLFGFGLTALIVFLERWMLTSDGVLEIASGGLICQMGMCLRGCEIPDAHGLPSSEMHSIIDIT